MSVCFGAYSRKEQDCKMKSCLGNASARQYRAIPVMHALGHITGMVFCYMQESAKSSNILIAFSRWAGVSLPVRRATISA